MSKPWSKKEAEIAYKAIAEHKLYKEVSIALEEEGFDRSAEAVRKFYKRNDVNNEEEYEVVEPEINNKANDDQYIAIEAIREMRDSLVKITSEKFVKVGRPVEANIKILSLSDLHIPFENPKIINKMLKNHGDADILVLNGDIFEIYALSKWPKKKNVLLRHEYEIAIEWMKLFTSIFPKIVLVSGNHESRVQSYFTANVDPAASFLVNKDILDRLAKGYSFNDEEGTFEKMYNWDDIVSYDGGLLKYYAIIGKTIFIHPNDFSGVPMRTVLTHCDDLMQCEKFQCMVMGHCFDEDTELLTNNGWRSIDTIQDSDEPLTLNTEINELEFNKCEGIFKYLNHKEIIAFKNNTGLEVLVTPEHGMLYNTGRNIDISHDWKKANAEEIENYSRFSIPASGLLLNEKEVKITDEMLKLLAWIVTEGNIQYTSANNPVIRISQSDDGSGFLYEIKHLLDSLQIEYSLSKRYEANTISHNQHRNYDAYRFYIGVEGSVILSEFLNLSNKTFNHKFIMSLSLRQRKILIEEMCKGDGSKCGTDHYCHYYTSNKDLLDQFQILCTLSGIRNKANIKRKDGTWVVSMTETTMHTITSSERREYNGKTWCLTVLNGTLVARRKGIVFLTQNTHKIGSYIWKNKLVLEQGCCCVPMDYEKNGRARKQSMQTYGAAVVYMDEEGNVDFDKTRNIYYGTGSPIKVSDAMKHLKDKTNG
jgi:predicted phosphodiesterase